MAARPVRRRSPDPTHTLVRQLPGFSESPIPNPQSRPPDMNRKGDKALIVRLHSGTPTAVARVGEHSPRNPIGVVGERPAPSRGPKPRGRGRVRSTVQPHTPTRGKDR